MGIGFVIIIHLIAIFILSIVIATVGSIITYFVTNKEKRKRKIILAFISPFVGLYTLYICGLIGSIIVSEITNVDVGIGDTWYVPLENNCQLLFIDVPGHASIEKNGQTVISGVLQIELNGNQISGKTNENIFFSYNTTTNELNKFANENELTAINSNRKPKLMSAIDFYTDRRNDISGIWLIIAGCISLISSITSIYLLRKLILSQFKPKKIKNYCQQASAFSGGNVARRTEK